MEITAAEKEEESSSYRYWAGTWEEKNLNSWASSRIKELLASIGLEFSCGKAEIEEVSKCLGDIEAKLSEEKDLLQHAKLLIKQDLKLFGQPIREKLLQFEQELKDR
ncbi:hypothetical protein IFM89_032345 [Coptis chinensis]|uniref:Activator of Hsp90 ATPase AHSA1-like N-terminal domain-containing protein n=1 Tax=Coptis chinensis TaxID=261450 RepID=A0A835M557_9MAGN|nr:hypothetical protein IFM89_032345 [Coptis chinensis]